MASRSTSARLRCIAALICLGGVCGGSVATVTAQSLNNLAVKLQHQGNYAEAESRFRESLARGEKDWGPNHPEVAVSLDNLAVLLMTVGRFDEAEPLLLRALAIHESGPKSSGQDLSNSINNLATLMQITGRSSQACPLLRHAIAIREETLGADHPDVAQSLNALALQIQTSGEYSEAEPLFRRALAIRESTLGAYHPDVAVSLNNLAEYLRPANRSKEVEPLLLRANAIAGRAGNPDLLAQIQASLMRYYSKSQPDMAISYGVKAVNNLQLLRKGLAQTNEKNLQQYTEKVDRTYYTLAKLLTENGQAATAKQVLRLLEEKATFASLQQKDQH